MSKTYTKVLRQNKISKKTFMDTIFNGDNPSFAAVNYYKANDPDNIALYNRMSQLEEPLWDDFEIFVNIQSNTRGAVAICEDYIPDPIIKSKKSRAKQHARLVLFEKISKIGRSEASRQGLYHY